MPNTKIIKNNYEEKFYETFDKYIKFNTIDITINNFPFIIQIKEPISHPNNYVFNCIKENDGLSGCSIDYGITSIGFKRYCNNIMCWNIYNKYIDDPEIKLKFNNIKVLSW